ncbi:amino acid adenylation domain-containing protein [Archangium violaceum]|uniref:non-ribosomal peptide synthetase n=1 Tax=Archangium violaceum TaxID=83451 RepID=UPI00194F69EB|nr:non-ribosomal peptide synthetase [Archangium violaceum]QRN93750.1 amino acid adenylation domain-containing protein [Archangium violaceum]
MSSPIAIVAAACRLPDADTPEAFWNNLIAERISMRPPPVHRWPEHPDARVGSFLDDVRGFDAAFFGMKGSEAQVTDPQQRLLLQTAHEALERAGFAGPRRRNRRVGVFVGVGQSDYQEPILRLLWAGVPVHPSAAVGNLRNLIPSRVSHVLDLSGPSLAVDTACSSSLVALHLACESLNRGECELALAGGITLNLTPTVFTVLSRAGALSPTGRIRPFAREADGIVLGEGLGVVVLERLEDALRRRAPILAVVRGSALNNDGRTFNPMAPNPARQMAVMREAWQRAGLEPASASYLEAHGTGTRVGDSIEARSVTEVFGRAGANEPLGLGSVKGNVGHLLSAAGMASLLKVVSSLQHRMLPASVHAGTADPEHGLTSAGIALVDSSRPWRGPGPLRAGINGFGFGGTNAHVILEEPPAHPPRSRSTSTRPPLWTLSARTDSALRATARHLASWLRENPEVDLSDAALSASVSRDPGPHRLALVGTEAIPERLEAWAAGASAEILHGMVPDRVARKKARNGASLEGASAELAASAFVEGEAFDRLSWDEEPEREHVPVPTYPFEPRPWWAPETPPAPAPAARRRIEHPLLVDELELTMDRAVLLARIAPDDPLVSEHVVHGVHLLPGAACIELMRAAARHALGTEPAGLADVTFARPVRVDDEARTVRVVVERQGEALDVSLSDEDGGVLARAKVLRAKQAPPPAAPGGDEPRTRGFEPSELYEGLRERGMAHGASLRAVRAIELGERTARAELSLPEQARERTFGVHPALLDSAMQPIAALLLAHSRERESLYVPVHVEQVELLGPVPDRCAVLVTLNGDPRTPGDVVLCEVEVRAGNEPRLRLRGLRLRRVTAEALQGTERDVHTWMREVIWREATPEPSHPPRGRWVIVPAVHPASPHVTRRLREAGATCERVDPPELKAALARGGTEGVVFLGPTGTATPLTDVASFDRGQRDGVFALLEVARVWDALERERRPACLLVVTAGATDGLAPERATVVGLGHALEDELPGSRCRVVDADVTASEEAIADVVLTEASCTAPESDRVFRWRRGRRERRTIEPLAQAGQHMHGPREKGVYLVTGGAEGLGHAVAQRLARAGRTLVLVGRKPLAHAPERAARIEALRANGAAVTYVACDVSDPDGVAGLIARIVLDHGALHGVVHAAGVASPGRIGGREDAAFAQVLGPKVRGTWLLWRELERRRIRPDFFALFSSLSASWPGLGGGLGDYVAANAYLDAFALARRAEALPFTSVAWSVWSETGMGADPTLVRAMEARGLPAIPTRQGVDAFLRVLELGRAHVMVAPIGPRATVSRPPPAVTLAPAPTAAPSSVVEELRSLVAKALEVDPDEVATDRSFLAMGLDSLNALDLAKILSDRYRVEFPPTLFFEQPTIDSLAEYLRKAKGDAAPERRPADTSPSTAPRTVVTEAPLSPVQKAFWVQQRLHPDVTAFSFVRQTVRGRLSLDALQRAVDAVARRHPLLRASVATTAHGEAVQRISETVRARLIDHGEVADVEALADGIVNTPFELSPPPLWRVDVARDPAADTTHVLICAHHLIVDGWSLHVIAADLWRAYAATVSGRPLPDWPEAHGFFDTLDVPRPRLDEDLAWWRERLSDAPAPRLPFDGDPLAPPDPPILSVLRWLDLERTRAFEKAAAAADVSVFHLSLAVHARCLARWSGTDEVIVNVARARRESRVPGIEQVVGCFADTLPLRLRLEPGESLALLAKRAREALLELERHASPTSLELARVLPGDAGSSRVTSAASYSYARIPLSPPAEVPELLALAGRTATPATRLGLAVWEFQGGLCFAWGFPERLFRKDTVERFADEHLRAHVEAGSAPRAESIPERIIARLQESPERVALREGERLLTRGELDQRSARVAATLTERGIGPGAVVALLSDQNAQGITGLLGILRTGAAWLPLDPEHPPARLRLQLERAGTRVCLFASGAASTASELTGAVTTLAIEHLVEPGALAPPVRAGDEALAYIIFTSGSTGRPKGVPITHGSMRGYLEWALQAFGYGAEDVLLGTSSLCFDASVRQVLAPLLAGATLVCCPRSLARDPERLLEIVDRERVTVLSTVPSVLARLLRYDLRPLERLRWLKVGGEALPPGLIRTLHDRLGRAPPVVNLYGPTETTINATWHVVKERPPEDVERIPIGRPIGGATVHVLAEDGSPCAPGVPGELHVGGRGLSSGYLGEPELTRRAFIPGAGGVRLYRTGDRVVAREDGTLDFLGRVDDQLKVHGHRIEPGEIEAVLARHPAVSLAVVRAVGSASERRLEAWIQFRDAPPTEDALRDVLREHLPEAMWPRHFHMLDSLPTTVTGKVDRAALEALSGAAPARTIRGGPPRTDTEQRIAEAFARVLSRAEIGRDDDFFELGGDSMAILEVFTRLQAMDLRLPRPATLYTARTVRALAEAIDAHSARSSPEPVVARAADAEEEWFPLSPAQRGFLVAQAGDPEGSVHWAARLLLEGELDSALFREALGRLVERHPMLRTVVDAGRRPPVQRVLEPGAPPLILVDPCTPDALDRLFTEARRRHFDPQKETPIELHLCRVAADRHVLLVAADHLIGDGLSGWMFVRELLQAYDGLARGAEPSLPPLRSTFRDYVRHLADRAETQDDAAFWRRTFAVPYVPPRTWYKPEGALPARDEVTLSSERVETLRASAARRGGTLFELVLAAWAFALRRLTGQDDLVIGTAVSGRDAPLPDVHRVFGPFATAVPLRMRDAGSAPQELLESVRGVVADARAHALTPGEIARAIPGGLPLEVAAGTRFFFTFMDFEAFGSLESERLRVHWEDSGTEGHVPRGVDLKLAARRLGGALRLSFHAAPTALGPQGLERVRADVLDVLEVLAGEPGTKARPPSRLEVRFGPIDVSSLHAALVGYLPAPEEAARAVGLAFVPSLREVLRSQLFPEGSPRWLERIDTPLGASGLLCLPLFADELGALAPETLAARVVEAVLLAHRTGVRAFSLAGMLPAYTGFGREVLHRLAMKDGAPEDLAFTTGHATTVVAVVRSILSATAAAGVNLSEAEVAFVGVGSIGAAAAELLLQVAAHPRRLLLCDLPRAARRMEEVTTRLREQYGFRGPIETALAPGAVADEVYRARVIVGAASTPGALEVDRLAPGTVLVDDSFPTLVDVPAARARMHTRGDVLIVGGGLLDCGTVTRTVDDTTLPPGLRPALSRGISRAGVASCQLEPLLRRMHPELPPVSGPVDAATAYQYWLVALASGLRAAPLHLGAELVPNNLPAALTERGNTG